MFPTKLNEELKPYIGKDFDMDVIQEGETLRVILTHDKRAKPKGRVHSSQTTQKQNPQKRKINTNQCGTNKRLKPPQ